MRASDLTIHELHTAILVLSIERNHCCELASIMQDQYYKIKADDLTSVIRALDSELSIRLGIEALESEHEDCSH